MIFDKAKNLRAQRAATVSVVATVVVVAVKFVAAFLSGSISVLAEGIQSTMDIVMSLLALFTIRYAARPADEDHPYGHGKAELLSSALQMLVILVSGAFILYQVYRRFLNPSAIAWDWGAIGMGYALISNFAVATHLRKVAKETQSTALASEALHLASDSLSSMGVLMGMIVVGSSRNSVFDPIVAAIFTIWAMIVAVKRLRAVLHPLMDGALPEEDLKTLEAVLHANPAFRGYHNLRTRQIGSHQAIEFHLMLDDHLTFVDAHDIAEQIEDEVRAALYGSLVNVHYEPYEAELAHREREHGESKPATKK